MLLLKFHFKYNSYDLLMYIWNLPLSTVWFTWLQYVRYAFVTLRMKTYMDCDCFDANCVDMIHAFEAKRATFGLFNKIP